MALACCGRLFRRKTIDPATFTETKLARILNGLDLTAIGIGNTLGAGVYVVTGAVSKNIAGPSIVVSFLIAAVASALAGLCYAEFGARVPKAGSAYVYTYVTVGEFWAFIIGWNLILEYIIGAASVAVGFSGYLDALFHQEMSTYLLQHAPLHLNSLSPYPDFVAFGLIILVTVVLCFGVKESTTVNNVFTLINLAVITFVIICGACWADVNNWNIPAEQIPVQNGTDFGVGGFLPYGYQGMLSGAASCFFAFIGFDCIATAGEEVKNPQKNIPISILLTLIFCFLAYFGVSTVITLMIPYYTIDPKSPLPNAFEDVGWYVAKYVVSIGAVCGLSASLIGSIFPLPRVIYAMASDGLLFRFLAYVNDRFKTPTLATLIPGFLAALIAMFFDIEHLIEMLSIGTLLAYTLVAACVLVLRHEVHTSLDDLSTQDVHRNTKDTSKGIELKSPAELSSEKDHVNEEKRPGVFTLLCNPPDKVPTARSAVISKICVAILAVLSIVISCTHQYLLRAGLVTKWESIAGLSVTAAFVLMVLFVLWRQPQSKTQLNFKVPLVPLLPTVSVYINVYLMLELSSLTWIRFAVWMAIGFLIYIFYGYWHSSENPMASYEDLVSGHSHVEETSKEKAQNEPNSKETTQLVKSMFK